MTLQKSILRAHGVLTLALIVPLAAPAQAQPRPQPPPSDKELVTLSPFEVVSENRGYYAPNTMSGRSLRTSAQKPTACARE